jgi:hypothetical protein
MDDEIKPETGSLFLNTDRQSDTSPAAAGKCLIDGKSYRVAAGRKKANPA